MTCIAIIISSGAKCTRKAIDDSERCLVHHRALLNNGPHTTALDELKAVHIRSWVAVTTMYKNGEITEEEKKERHRVMKMKEDAEKAELIAKQKAEIAQTGIRPDHAAIMRKKERQDAKKEAIRIARQRMDDAYDNFMEPFRRPLVIIRLHEYPQEFDEQANEFQNKYGQLAAILHIGNNEAYKGKQIDLTEAMGIRDRMNEIYAVIQAALHEHAEQIRRDDMAEFVNDKQNVHTTVAVNQTKEVVEKVLKIEVPEEYKWNKELISKTFSDIVTNCKLTPSAVWQMSSKYCSDEPIYELGDGIYGRVLDCVWQFILKSDDKDCLIKILKTEMEDNIGMCAQGNLSRLCNILAGYMDGIAPPENMSDKLGRLFSELLAIDDVEERLVRGFSILKAEKVPESDWDAWIEPLK